MKLQPIIFLFLLLANNFLNAQWSEDWQSGNTGSLNIAGWVDITDNNVNDYSYYILDAQSFRIMNGAYSNSVKYSYSFTAEEISAGYQIYSLEYDLTGDGISDFYVLAYHDSETNPRQSFKILDITNGNVILEKGNSSEYYTYPAIWDADNDGILECSFAVYDYPNFSGYRYEVLNTGVVTSFHKSSGAPSEFRLMQNYPNPFNPSTTFRYSLENSGKVVVQVIDVKGELVNTLVDEYQSGGVHETVWNGQNSAGSKVASGPYFYRLISGDKSITRKMVLIK